MNATRNTHKSGIEPAVNVPQELTPELKQIAKAWPERFLSKVAIKAGCWEWTAGKAYGYGRYSMGRNSGFTPMVWNAQRAAWYFTNGDLPDDFHVDHLCRNHGCVRPDHLEPVPPRTNAQRGRQANVAGLCRAGKHEWKESNIMMEGETRRCRPCRDEREKAYRPAQGNAFGLRTHCPQGHEYNAANTRLKGDGSRDCRLCHRVAVRIKYRAKRGLPITEAHYVA